MIFTVIQQQVKTADLAKLMKRRQACYVEMNDPYGRTCYDTFKLGKDLSGSELKEFYRQWFKQIVYEDGSTVELNVNKKWKAVLTNGKWKDKVILELIKEGFLVLKRDGSRARINEHTGKKPYRCNSSFLVWSGK